MDALKEELKKRDWEESDIPTLVAHLAHPVSGPAGQKNFDALIAATAEPPTNQTQGAWVQSTKAVVGRIDALLELPHEFLVSLFDDVQKAERFKRVLPGFRPFPRRLGPRAALSLFLEPRFYTTLRRLIMAHADTVRRTKWSAFVPENSAAFNPDDNATFHSVFENSIFASVGVLKYMAIISWAVRRRLAEDVGLTNALVRGALASAQLIRTVFAADKGTHRDRLTLVEQVSFGSALLSFTVVENPRPWLQYLNDKRDTRICQVLSRLATLALQIALEEAAFFEKERESGKEWSKDEEQEYSNCQDVTGTCDLLCEFFKSEEKALAYIAENKGAMENSFGKASVTKWEMCDGCRKEVETSSELKRCSRCRVAHYCGADCQKRAWAEHKKGCFNGLEMRLS